MSLTLRGPKSLYGAKNKRPCKDVRSVLLKYFNDSCDNTSRLKTQPSMCPKRRRSVTMCQVRNLVNILRQRIKK